MTSPSDLLAAAADRVRDLAAQATPGPWETIKRFDKRDNHVMSSFIRPPMDPKGCVQDRNIRPHEHADYAWVAAMSPEIAKPIERWLRETAESAAHHEPVWRSCSADGLPEPKRTDAEVAALLEHHYGAALALARVILGVGLAGETP